MNKGLRIAIAALAVATIPYAQAIMVNVDAKVHSSSAGAGTGFDTGIGLVTGQAFGWSAASEDLWNAGALPRWSNANGLVADLFATGSDESGQVVGTLIGQNFGNHTSSGLAAPFGSLVGKIGSGSFFLMGLSGSTTANATGNLNLFYWDSNSSDNTESIKVTFKVANGASVPDQGGLILSFLGFGMMFLFSRMKKRA